MAHRTIKKKSIFICDWCSREFEEWTYRHPRFCSNQCRSVFAARQPKPSQRRPENFIDRICAICGKSFKVHRIYINRPEYPNQGKYCSRKCKYEGLSQQMKGINNINYTGVRFTFYRGSNWKEQSKLTRERDYYTCQKCGTSPATNVHHIIPYKDFGNDYISANQLDNLITLCRTCHFRIEGMMKSQGIS